MFVLREKYLTFCELYPTASRIKKMLENTEVKPIISSDIDVAEVVKADGEAYCLLSTSGSADSQCF